MKIIISTVLCTLLTATVSNAQVFDKVIDVSIGSGIVLQAVDTNLTTFIIAKNLGKEANPVFIPFANHPIASPVIKSSIAVATSAMMLHYKDDHPVIVFISSIVTNSFYIWVDHHNGLIAKGHY